MLAARGDSALAELLYSEGTNGINDTLLQRYAGGFDKAVTAVYSSGRKNAALEREFRINASRFGTYKAYDLSQKLEALRSLGKDEYTKQAEALIARYNGFQRVEYDTLVARTRTAKQLERFAEEKDLYPNLEWIHTRSARPRETHLAYVGLILPQDHPFFNDNLPGNEWECKCDLRATDAPITSTPNVTVKPATGLEGNPLNTGELVTDNHPYFSRNTDAPEWVESKALLQTPDEVGYTTVNTASGSYREHILTGQAAEAAVNREIAQLLTANGYKDISLLPQIYAGEKRLRKRYYGASFVDKHPTACPDAAIGSVMVEFKTTRFKLMSKRVKEAAAKSDIAVLRVNQPLDKAYVERFIKGQWELQDRGNLKEILLINMGELYRFKRP